MGAEIKIFGRVRQLLQALDVGSPGDDEQMALTDQYAQLVAMDAAPFAEITRIGRAFKVQNSAAIAAVVAPPTTAVMLAIFNNDADGGRSLIVDRVWAQNIVSTAVAGQAQIIGLIGQVREPAPVDSGLLIRKLNGLGGGQPDTKARSIIGGTALPATTGIAADWFPIGSSASKIGAAATPGYGMEKEVGGRIIVPPGRYFAMHVLAMVVGETFIGGIEYHEKVLRLG